MSTKRENHPHEYEWFRLYYNKVLE